MSDKQTDDLVKEVKSELQRIGDDVKRTAEDALKQSKDAGAVSAEVKAKADELLAAQAKLTAQADRLEARQLELEQKTAARRDDKEPAKTLGQMVVESDELKAFVKNGARGSMSVGVKNAITSSTSSAGDLIVPHRETEIVGIPRRQMTIRQLLSVGRTTSNLVEYAKQVTRTNAARMVTEGGQKPESNYVWDLADASVRTLAHFVHVSRQAMEDAVQLQSEIDGELRYGLDLVEEGQLLIGDGLGQNLSGLVTEADAYSAAFTPDAVSMIDVLRLAILQVALNEYPATGIVLHPTDWARIELTKDGEERYIFASPIQMAGPTLWGRPVIPTQSMSEDEFLVGAFAQAAKIYDRMDAEVLISSEHADNFIKNMLTVRAEKRLALAVKRPSSLVTGDFGNVT